MLKLVVLCLIASFGVCYCACGAGNANNTEAATPCVMGACIDGTCICSDGWGGTSCDTCMGRVLLSATTGFITDGLENYSHSSKCSWLVQPHKPNTGFTLRLRFHELATECGWDYLYIYDGDSAFSPLIGSFSGLIYIPGQSNQIMPEVVAKSGTAFLQFYSDLASTLSGFNISYSVDECRYDCFNHGNCSSGSCQCRDAWAGQTCDQIICPDNCSSRAIDNCSSPTDFGTCPCNHSSCTVSDAKGSWTVSELNSSITARASYAVSSINGNIWIYGGMQFDTRSSNNQLVVFDSQSQQWRNIEETNNTEPEMRYEHSMVAWNQSLLVFGGKLVRNEATVNEMWQFDLRKSNWSRIDYTSDFNNSAFEGVTQLNLAGHSADLVQFENGTEIMVVLFGYHPTMTYSRFVYEYNPATRVWSMPRPNGVKVPGLFGHSTAYDPINGLIYIHGGYRVFAPGSSITSETYSYDPKTRHFSTLKRADTPRYLHSATFLDGVMYVYGGSPYNDTTESSGAKCYSSNLAAYYPACDSWITLSSPSMSLNPGRYGHDGVLVRAQNENSSHEIYIFSGYDSTMISDMVIYKPATCQAFSESQSVCFGSFNLGVSCYWNGSACLPILLLNTTDSYDTSCPLRTAEQNAALCEGLTSVTSCSDCLSNPYNCTYCSSKCHGSDFKCSEPVSSDTCDDRTDSYCSSLVNCEQCMTAGSECLWHARGGCVVRPLNSTETPSCQLQVSCSLITSCEGCSTAKDCLWCLHPEKCIDSNSYVPSFPYGQCRLWSNNGKCPSFKCSTHKTCAQCQNYSSCGWCDDGSYTGLGTCVDGSGAGPLSSSNSKNDYLVDNSVCPSDSWYFTSCPSCQCNGHSKCNDAGDCVQCTENTTGPQCATCTDGYYGDSLNGGQCSPCQCNGKAETCDPSTGLCYCTTKGVKGEQCELCDSDANYVGNASGNGTCYYPLQMNYVFTFTLNGRSDEHVTAINFVNLPTENEDVQMSFDSEKLCDVRMAVRSAATEDGELTLGIFENTLSVRFTFRTGDHHFGNRNFNTTIFIYSSNFTFPNGIKISLLQRSNTLLTILLILFSSFLVILILAAIVWKVKLVYDAHRQRANRAVEMQQMAARPFAQVNLCCDDIYRSTQALLAPDSYGFAAEDNIGIPEAMCEEKCGDERSSVVSVFLWLPSSVPSDSAKKGEDGQSTSDSDAPLYYVTPPNGQSALAIGTVLTDGRKADNEQASSTSTPRSLRGVHVELDRHQDSRTDKLPPTSTSLEPTIVPAYSNHDLNSHTTV